MQEQMSGAGQSSGIWASIGTKARQCNIYIRVQGYFYRPGNNAGLRSLLRETSVYEQRE